MEWYKTEEEAKNRRMEKWKGEEANDDDDDEEEGLVL